MNVVRERIRAYRAVLEPAFEIGIHAHENLTYRLQRMPYLLTPNPFKKKGADTTRDLPDADHV